MKNFFLATYLAVKEVIRNKGRFFLVALVIALDHCSCTFYCRAW